MVTLDVDLLIFIKEARLVPQTFRWHQTNFSSNPVPKIQLKGRRRLYVEFPVHKDVEREKHVDC